MPIARFFGVKTDPTAGGSTVTLAGPVIGAATPSASGGTLPAGTYYYRVTAVNAAGETVGSGEVSAVTTGSTGSVSVAFTTVTGATGYRLYRGATSGGQSLYTAGAGTPIIDIGGAGTVGTVPVLSTARIVIPDADDIYPVTGVTLDRNVVQLDRNSEITGFRGNPIPEEFRKDPRETVSALAYQRLIEKLVWSALGSADIISGSGTAARTHLSTPVGYGGSGLLPALYTSMFRDEQSDKMSGGYVNSVTVNFTLDGHGTVEAEIWGLYHNSQTGQTIPVLTRNSRDITTLKLRDLRAYFGGSPVSVPGVTGFTFTYSNNIVDDSEARFAAGQAVDTVVGSDGVTRRVWYPSQHFLGGSQTVSGDINFSSPKQAEDVKHELAQAEQIVAEVYGKPMATTPVATELMRFTVLNAVRTGGGAEALQKEGLQKSSYQYGGFIGNTGTDVRVESVSNSSTAIV